MEPITCFSLETHAGEYKDWPLTSRLLEDGRPTDTFLTGYTIEQQFRGAAGFVLATSCDCPFEERTTFYLLDERRRIASSVSCFTPYDTWLLDRMEPLDGWSLRVVFFKDYGMILHIAPDGSGGWKLDLVRA